MSTITHCPTCGKPCGRDGRCIRCPTEAPAWPPPWSLANREFWWNARNVVRGIFLVVSLVLLALVYLTS
ncbi:MAG: hypothetical protein H6907_16810 [Hyphomicrobiales bacterium]|nr:hypothetical protein [Hyphomicrobiales bacterium]